MNGSSYTPAPTPSHAFQAIRTPPPAPMRDTGAMVVAAQAAALSTIERLRVVRIRLDRLGSVDADS